MSLTVAPGSRYANTLLRFPEMPGNSPTLTPFRRKTASRLNDAPEAVAERDVVGVDVTVDVMVVVGVMVLEDVVVGVKVMVEVTVMVSLCVDEGVIDGDTVAESECVKDADSDHEDVVETLKVIEGLAVRLPVIV